MSSFFNIPQIFYSISFPTSVTCSGTVTAPHGAGIRRKVFVTPDNDHNKILAITESNEPFGTFSMTVPGLETTEFSVFVKGNRGENDEVWANTGISVTGPTGLYIAPPLNNLPFVVGPGDVTSPFVDILFPTPVIDAEGEVEIVAWGDIVAPLTVVEGVGVTDIIPWGNLSFAVPAVNSVVDNYYVLDGQPIVPMWQVDSFAENGIIAWGNVEFSGLQVKGIFGQNGTVDFPVPAVSATALNPIVCAGDIDFKAMVVAGAGEFGKVSWAGCVAPSPIVDGYSVVNDIAYGDASFPSVNVSAKAEQLITSIGIISFPSSVVAGNVSSTTEFEPINYEPDCGLADPIGYGAISIPMFEVAAV